jgi:hypothetical protein
MDVVINVSNLYGGASSERPTSPLGENEQIFPRCELPERMCKLQLENKTS